MGFYYVHQCNRSDSLTTIALVCSGLGTHICLPHHREYRALVTHTERWHGKEKFSVPNMSGVSGVDCDLYKTMVLPGVTSVLVVSSVKILT